MKKVTNSNIEQNEDGSEGNLIRYIDLLIKMDQSSGMNTLSPCDIEGDDTPYLIKSGIKIIL